MFRGCAVTDDDALPPYGYSESRIGLYGLAGRGMSRVASVYMTWYTLGGVLGSAAGTAAYRLAGWGRVSAVGAACMAVAFTVWVRVDPRCARST